MAIFLGKARRREGAPTAKAKAFAPLVAYSGIYWGYNVLTQFTGHPSGAVGCWELELFGDV